MKMKLIGGSETSAIRTQTPGNYPKENILQTEYNRGGGITGYMFLVIKPRAEDAWWENGSG